MNDFISFPKLGLTFNISDTIVDFQLFGLQFSLKWYGLLIAVGFLLAVIYALRRSEHFGINPDAMIDVVLVSALFAFLGARLYYVLFSDERASYFEKPLSILYIWQGGLAIYGGVIFAFITALWMCRVRKVNTLAMFDMGALGFLIGQCIGRWGNFFNQEAFGGNTNLPWGMTGSIIQQGIKGSGYDTDLPVHPTFLYESLWCLLGFILLHIVSKKAYKFKGQLFTMYIMWYGLGRFMIEGLRTDSLYFGTMRISQIIAVLSVLGGLALFFLLRARHNSLPVDLFADDAGGTIALDEEALMDDTDEDADESEEPEESEKTETDESETNDDAIDAGDALDVGEEIDSGDADSADFASDVSDADAFGSDDSASGADASDN